MDSSNAKRFGNTRRATLYVHRENDDEYCANDSHFVPAD
jgi:hypothetical protein